MIPGMSPKLDGMHLGLLRKINAEVEDIMLVKILQSSLETGGANSLGKFAYIPFFVIMGKSGDLL